MINAVNFQSEAQLEALLKSLGFDSRALTSSDWIRCPLDEKTAIARAVKYVIVAVVPQKFYVLYYDEMEDMYALWGELIGDAPETALRDLVLEAASPAVIKRMEKNIRAILVAQKLAERLGQFVSERNLGWLWQGHVNFSFGQPPETIYQVATFFVPRERLRQEPGWTLEVAPELVIETVHPYPTAQWVGQPQRLEAFFRGGVEWVWIIKPEEREILVYHHTVNQVTVVYNQDIIRGAGTLTGFKMPVAELMEVQVHWSHSYPLVQVCPRIVTSNYKEIV